MEKSSIIGKFAGGTIWSTVKKVRAGRGRGGGGGGRGREAGQDADEEEEKEEEEGRGSRGGGIRAKLDDYNFNLFAYDGWIDGHTLLLK